MVWWDNSVSGGYMLVSVVPVTLPAPSPSSVLEWTSEVEP